jgi:hypothetical protein
MSFSIEFIKHAYLPVKSTATVSNNANNFRTGNIKMDPYEIPPSSKA